MLKSAPKILEKPFKECESQLIKVAGKVKKDSLIVIGRLSYPSGSAPSNRVHLYCKALKKENGFPFVINLHSTFTTPQNFNYLGRYEGIPFYYAQKTPMREKMLLIRNLNKIKGLINTLFILLKIKKKHDFKVLFFATTAWDEFILFIFLKAIGISTIRECNEIPDFIIHEKKAIKLNNFLLKIKFKMYDEIIVISDYLKDYYSSKFPQKKIFQLPILVDLERFQNSGEKKKQEKKRITYIGYMGGNKDGLNNLIEATALIKERNNNIQLELAGSAPKADMLRLKNKIKTLNLENTIFFLGKKNVEEIPSLLSNSDLLVLARPENNQAKAGFPTKLGEYLASATPIVITVTGEIPKYLKDNVSAYLAKPDDIADFAEKVVFALSDENSETIGKKGYEVAKENFNYQLYGKEIIKIIQS